MHSETIVYKDYSYIIGCKKIRVSICNGSKFTAVLSMLGGNLHQPAVILLVNCFLVSASEMTYLVSGGALNSTHSPLSSF